MEKSYLIIPGIGERLRQAYERGYTPKGTPMPPHYPMPATMQTAVIMSQYYDMAMCLKYRLGFVCQLIIIEDVRDAINGRYEYRE